MEGRDEEMNTHIHGGEGGNPPPPDGTPTGGN
jgi:hypothetical protein